MQFKDITLADVSIETKVETLGIALDQKLDNLEVSVSAVSKAIGPEGPKGEKGDTGAKGDKGEPGPVGKNGLNGKDGADGKDGIDGKDGVSIVDVNIAADNSLVVTLSNGNEIDAGVIDLLTGQQGNVYNTVMRTNEVPVYAVRYDQVSATVSYRGEANPGLEESALVWRIQKLVVSNDDVIVTWANGNTAFANAWTDRLSLTYS